MNWIILIAGLLNLFLGVLVWSKNKRSKINSLFALFAIASAILCFSDFIFRYFPTLSIVKISYAFAIIAPTFAILWVLELVGKKISTIYKTIFLLFSSVLFLVTIFTDLVVKKVFYLTIFGYKGEFGQLFNYYSFYILLLILFIIIELVLALKKARSTYRSQLLYVLAGLTFYGVLASIFSLVLPSTFNNYNLTLLDAPSSLFFIGFSAYAIMKYRLMGIRTIVSRIYVYTLIAVYAYSFFYFAVFVEEFLFETIYSNDALLFAPVLAFTFSIFFVPLFKKIQTSSDVIFYRGYNPKEILKDLALKLSSSINLEQLLKTFTAEFKRILATDEIDVFLFKKDTKDKGDVCISVLKNRSKKLKITNVICQSVLKEKLVLVRDEVERLGNVAMVKELDRLKAKVIAPLILRHHVIGLIFLGEKMSGDAYNQEDIEFLEIISNQAAVAIENANLYQEVEDFNETLQQKVDEQTKELSDKAEHLKKLMEMRSEFLDITSHQLRTPVTVIKGVLSMIEEGSIPPARMKEFISGALDKSIKLGEIINDILRASEMDTDKFTMTVGPVDLNEILEKIQQDKLRSAQIKNVELIFNLPKEPLPPVISNTKYIEQAIINLVNNSFQYTVKGSITVSAEVNKEALVIRVADTGIGIPAEQIPKLFQKFARAENAVQTFTDGSGLGLFIIKQIVDANPGAKIEIEKTEINKGTTFALTLPLAPAVPAAAPAVA